MKRNIYIFEKGHHWFITQNLCGRGNKDEKVYFIFEFSTSPKCWPSSETVVFLFSKMNSDKYTNDS